LFLLLFLLSTHQFSSHKAKQEISDCQRIQDATPVYVNQLTQHI